MTTIHEDLNPAHDAGAAMTPYHLDPSDVMANARRAISELHHTVHLVAQLYGKPLGTALAGENLVELQFAVDQLEELLSHHRATAAAYCADRDRERSARESADVKYREYLRRWLSRSQAVQDVEAERLRHVEEEGRTAEHDDQHTDDELALAAAAYAMPAHRRVINGANGKQHRPWFWPWRAKDWKPGNRRRELVKATALLIAEIERIDRARLRAEACG